MHNDFKPLTCGDLNHARFLPILMGDPIIKKQRNDQQSEILSDFIIENTHLLNAITDGVYILNEQWKYIFVNDAASAFINIPVSKLVGRSILDIFPSFKENIFFKVYRHVMDTGEPAKITDEFMLNDGSKGFFEVSVFKIPLGIMCIARDVTENKKYEKLLENSTNRYKLATSAGKVCVWDFDQVKGTLFIDPMIFQFLGYDHEEMKANFRALKEIMHPTDRERVQETMARVQDGKIYTFQENVRMFRKSGETAWFCIQGKALHDEDDHITRIIGTFMDITRLVLTEQKLAESEAKFRDAFTHSPLGMAMVATDGSFLSINQRFCELLGYGEQELLQSSFQDITHRDDMTENDSARQELLDGKIDVYTTEKRYVKKDGTILWARLSTTLHRDTDGVGLYFISIIKDITDRKRAEGIVEELERMKAEFLQRVAHDLKNPLAVLYGYTSFLQDLQRKGIKKDIKPFLEQMEANCNKLKNMIDKILKSSKMEYIALKPSYEIHDLGMIINECIENMSSYAASREHEIIVDLGSNLQGKVDKASITDAINNLLSNAIKYTPVGGHVHVSAFKEEHYITIQIQDNGIGITRDERELLFKKFSKMERENVELDNEIGGIGLGLFIVKKIVELHGGSVHVESGGRNKGSTFTILLPEDPRNSK